MKHSKENPFKRYMDFLYEIHELSDEELLVYNGIGKEFLQLIETTDMQKVYKISLSSFTSIIELMASLSKSDISAILRPSSVSSLKIV